MTVADALTEHAEVVSAVGTPVHLRATFATPTDEIVLAVFDSAAEHAVAEVCRRAGCPAQRLTTHVDARFWPAKTQGTVGPRKVQGNT